MPSKVIKIVTGLMFLSINSFGSFSELIFNPHLAARAETSVSRAHNIFNITYFFSYKPKEANRLTWKLQTDKVSKNHKLKFVWVI